MSSSEYAALAREKTQNSDFSKAEKYFVKATQSPRDDIAKATAFRDLGVFYFQAPLRNFTKGREYFAKALAATNNGPDDYSMYTTGLTYEQMGLCEIQNGFQIDGQSNLTLAREYYHRIKLPNPIGKWAVDALDRRLGLSTQ